MIDNNILRIEYPTGTMNLFIDRFFPTQISRANIVFKLMADNSPEEDIRGLYYKLRDMAEGYRQDVDHYNAMIDSSVRPKKYDEIYDKLKACQKKHAEAVRNMRDLKKITKVEV